MKTLDAHAGPALLILDCEYFSSKGAGCRKDLAQEDGRRGWDISQHYRYIVIEKEIDFLVISKPH